MDGGCRLRPKFLQDPKSPKPKKTQIFGLVWDILKKIGMISNHPKKVGFIPRKLGSPQENPKRNQKIWVHFFSLEACVITAFLLFEKSGFHWCDPVTLRSDRN